MRRGQAAAGWTAVSAAAVFVATQGSWLPAGWFDGAEAAAASPPGRIVASPALAPAEPAWVDVLLDSGITVLGFVVAVALLAALLRRRRAGLGPSAR